MFQVWIGFSRLHTRSEKAFALEGSGIAVPSEIPMPRAGWGI